MSTFVNNNVASGAVIYASDHNEQGSRIATVLNGGIDNANINASAAIATSKLADDAGISTAKIANAAVTASKIALGGATAIVTTDQSTTSLTYTDLSTTGPSVTVTIGANGLALIIVSTGIYNTAAAKFAGVAISGASTVAASDDYAARNDSATAGVYTTSWLQTGLTAGSTTFTMKYKTASGTASFFSRKLTVIPL